MLTLYSSAVKKQVIVNIYCAFFWTNTCIENFYKIYSTYIKKAADGDDDCVGVGLCGVCASSGDCGRGLWCWW